jgi:hypothetical protein
MAAEHFGCFSLGNDPSGLDHDYLISPLPDVAEIVTDDQGGNAEVAWDREDFLLKMATHFAIEAE